MSDADEYPDIFRGAREYVLSALPENVRALHHKIESFSGLPVDFRPVTMLSEIGITVGLSDGSNCDAARAYVTVDDRNGINPNAVTHELLHIHRYWVDGVPALNAADESDQNIEFMTWLDNALEHLVIVPWEREFGYDPNPYWAKMMENFFVDLPSNLTHQVRRSCLMGWTITGYCEDPHARAIALSKLQSFGLQREARFLLQNLLKQRRNKEKMVRASLVALKVPPSSARLVHYDVRNRRRVVTQIS